MDKKDLFENTEDRSFCPYFTNLVVKEFENHTGCKVSDKQKSLLRQFLIEWTEDNFNSSLEARCLK